MVPFSTRSFRFVSFTFIGRRRLNTAIAVGLLLIGFVAIQTVTAGDWTQFQGNRNLDVEPSGLPLTWSPTENLLWSAEINGYGQSSPVTWQNRVFVTSISGEKKEHCHVTAFDLKSGTKLWQHDFLAATQAENNNYISRGAPTPAVDASGLYCFFEGGNLLALTHAGQVRWERNLVTEFGEIKSRHGLSASLEQTPDRLFVWVERQTEPYVLAVDKAAGKDIWKVDGMGATSWASPRLVNVTGGQHLVLSAIGSVTGLDPADGKRLWRLEGITGNSSPTPIPVSDNRFLVAATVGRGEPDSGKAAASNGMVEIRRNAEGAFQADYLWRAKRATSSFGSPLAYRGMAYYVNATGVLYGLDAETGEERFAQRLADSIWATPIASGERVLFCGKGGTVSVIATGTQFEKLAENSAWETPSEPAAAAEGRGNGNPVLYAAAPVADRLLLRSGNRLYCVGAAKQ